MKYGADVIKVVATGGVLSEGDAVGATQYTLDEMKALVDESKKLDRKVAAHAHGTEGIKIAVEAGVSSIEHGSFLDEEGASLMKKKGTYLVPTLSAGERVARRPESGVLKGERAEKAKAAAKGMRNAIKLAVKEGVPIALGTDAGVIPHGANGREFFLMVDWGGMKPMDAIVCGTRNAADLLGWGDKIGTLEKGKLADVVAVPGNPLDDIHAMEIADLRDEERRDLQGAGGRLAMIAESNAPAFPRRSLGEPLEIGGVPIPSRFFLAPLAGYTSLAYRLAVRENGGLGLATTDLVNARAILENRRRSAELAQTCPEDRPIAIQILRPRRSPRWSRPRGGWSTRGPRSSTSTWDAPSARWSRSGGGSALMCDSDSASRAGRGGGRGGRAVPVTVKMRLGWDADNLTAPILAREFEQVGAAAVILHGRTREQGFRGGVDREGIRATVEAVDSMPIVGNGDVRTIADAETMFRETGCAAVSIGRGSLANPFLFRQLARWAEHRRPRPRADLLGAGGRDGAALPPPGRASRREDRLPRVPQDHQVVQPRHPPARSRSTTA